MNEKLAKSFHGLFDAEAMAIRRGIELHEYKYSIVQHREVAYQFFLHQHPFAQPLMARLMRKSVAGLLAADTEYVSGEVSLPFGVDAELSKAVDAKCAAGAAVSLTSNITVQGAGGQIELAKGLSVFFSAGSTLALFAGTRFTLADATSQTPGAGETLTLSKEAIAVVRSVALVKLKSATGIKMSDGTALTLPAGTEVRLEAGADLALPAQTTCEIVRRRMQPVADLYAEFFEKVYQPNKDVVGQPHPVKDLDFTPSGAYSVYNWELFFHVPLTIAIHLSKNQRYAEAQRWFHFIFDPTTDSSGPSPERFWKVRPFQSAAVRRIEDILVNLATGADAELRRETVASIEAWKDAPFKPHVIARYRQQAFMVKTVTAYLDNLIAWGDQLFRQDTGEAIDEAMMLYVLAAGILGPRPQPVPSKGRVRPQTYAQLRQDLARSELGSVLRDVESDIAFDLLPFPSGGTSDEARLSTIASLGQSLYFCVPRNDKLLGYWDTVADRLFKIRNSLNIRGVFRQLALFEPPIDPALLARAAASGLDIGAIVNGVNQPLPLVRFALLAQKASEIAQEVKSLGSSLLATIEKDDAEALTLLRSAHEKTINAMVEQVRYAQLQEAIKAREGLERSLETAKERYAYYERLLDKPAEGAKAQTQDDFKNLIKYAVLKSKGLDSQKLTLEELTKKLTADEKAPDGKAVEIDTAGQLDASGGRNVSSHESEEMSKLKEARASQETAATWDKVAGSSAIIPGFGAHFSPFGTGGSISFGGSNLASAASFIASFHKTDAEASTYDAGKSAKVGGYARREQDWQFQRLLAVREIDQVMKQLRAAEIREAAATLELRNHRKQMEHAAAVHDFLNENGTDPKGKVANKAFYAWMKREVKGLYAQCFQLAFDIARKAERALQHELGKPDATYLEFGYLAGKEGLLAGEKLHLDIKRMELAYHEQNEREYELTKHVSLLQLDPLALGKLRTTGKCTFQIPETLFDMDGPGHYFRRIKSVAVSIPCVTGPYSGAACTLTLLRSSIRKTAALDGSYGRRDAEDARFDDYFGSLQSIVTSSAQGDSGLFEPNLRDERYLPFEGAGAVSEWQLQLPADPSKKEPMLFDYQTISDVILHVRFTAREGGTPLRSAAMSDLIARIKAASPGSGTTRLFSVRHEFPGEWSMVMGPPPADGGRIKLALKLRDEHYPFWSQGRLASIVKVELWARRLGSPAAALTVYERPAGGDRAANKETLRPVSGMLFATLSGGDTGIVHPDKPVGELALYFDGQDAAAVKDLADFLIAVTWKGPA